jgi:hypothetical protein
MQEFIDSWLVEFIDSWLVALNEKSNSANPVKDREVKYTLEPGRKYIRVVREETWNSINETTNHYGPVSKRVHAFIDNATGDIYKAASWKTPAKNGARFNVVNDIETLLRVCDPYGSYLYKR